METSVDFRDTPLGTLVAGLSGLGVGALALLIAFYFVVAIVCVLVLAFFVWLAFLAMSS